MPTNEGVHRFGIAAEDCYCCYQQGKDDINHILLTRNFANYIWKYHAAILGVTQLYTNIRSQLMHWRNQHTINEVHKLIMQILPNYICWNLWKNRCGVKYGHKTSSIKRVQYGIFKDIMQVIRLVYPIIPWQSSLYHLIKTAEHCHQQYKIIMVSWQKPKEGIYKLNTDGSAIQDTGKIGGGGILRDHTGKIIYAFSVPLDFGTNNMAELKAAAYGLEWCQQHGYKRIALEVDS